ncbi:type II secretion system minor pseudopilin GspI [Yersinia intermedia]|uniref:type II secretion system minor pseudopilin GspI n=1 Tax=Yersinia intermedia TaxID=631 RepID=UPI0012D48AD7|nr:type II secretion system minor pseudopilin GspI [Yersinia intermedia]MDA5513068.1 type II secretion system minor pseudopilin GspI [Yersinia intermedia]
MRHYTGFTLLEVMVSLAIFAIAGVSIMKNISSQLIWTRSLQDKMASAWVAENVLAELKITGVMQTENWLKGSDFMFDQFWYWQVKEIYHQSKGIRDVIVEIRSQENNEHPDYVLERYRTINE